MEVMIRTWNVRVFDGIEFELALVEHMAILEPSVAHYDEDGNYAGYSGGDFVLTLMLTDPDICSDGVHTVVHRGEAWSFKPDNEDVLMREFVLDYLGYDLDDHELYEEVWHGMEFDVVDNSERDGTEVFENVAA